MMVVVLIRILTVRRLVARGLCACDQLTLSLAASTSSKKQIVQNIRVVGNLEADRARLHITALNLPQ